MKDPRETLLSWLNDAYSMERGQIQVLENHVNDVRDKNPEAFQKLAEHLEKTRMHADRVEQCVARLGGSTSSVKTAMGTIAGFFQGRSTGAAPDELVKNALSDYAAEHFEIACYRALIAGARALGQNEVVQICEEILRDEEDMARWLERQLPLMVQEYLGQTAAAGVNAGNYNPGTGNPGGVTRF
ncbi:MAG TPA: ferritin-like domain-containing protein [Thermoanaerobaculia bacterium]